MSAAARAYLHRHAQLCRRPDPAGAGRRHARFQPVSRCASGKDRRSRAEPARRLPDRRAANGLSSAGLPHARRGGPSDRTHGLLQSIAPDRREAPPARPQRRRNGERHARRHRRAGRDHDRKRRPGAGDHRSCRVPLRLRRKDHRRGHVPYPHIRRRAADRRDLYRPARPHRDGDIPLRLRRLRRDAHAAPRRAAAAAARP